MLQRQSTRVNLTVTFKYNRGTHESGSYEHEHISNPEDFAANYRELCKLKTELVDRKSNCFPAPYYSIELSGTRNDKPFAKTFSDIDDYHFFLIRHNLWAEPPSSKHKMI